MRRFILVRTADDAVVEKGKVAEGVVFSFGRTVICWTSEPRSYTVYDCFADMVGVQAKNGKTHIQWIDVTSDPGGETKARRTGSQALNDALKVLGDLTGHDEQADLGDAHLLGTTLDLTVFSKNPKQD
jgi:hypothetical protein